MPERSAPWALAMSHVGALSASHIVGKQVLLGRGRDGRPALPSLFDGQSAGSLSAACSPCNHQPGARPQILSGKTTVIR